MKNPIEPADLKTLYDASRVVLATLHGDDVARFREAIPADPGPAIPRPASWTPGTDALATATPAPGFERYLALLQRLGPGLDWRQSYKRTPQMESYLKGYGYIEFLGQRGHYGPGEVAFGIGVIGPGCHYPTHRHGPEEIYVPVAGFAEWSYDDGPWVAHGPGEVVYTAPHRWHSLRTTTETIVMLYAWLGGDPVNISEFRAP